MALTLSTDDLARLTAAARALASPLAYATTDDWRRDALRAVAAFARAESAWFLISTAPRMAVTHHTDAVAEHLIGALLAPYARASESTGDASLDAVIAYTVRERPATWDLHTADRATGGTGATWRSAWYHDVLLPFGAGDLAALYAVRPSSEVVLSVQSFRRAPTAGEATARLGLLHPALTAGLDALDRAGAHRAALDALDAPAAFFDADGREAHRTPALARLLDADPDGPRLADAIATLAQQMRRHAFGGAASPPGVHVQTLRGVVTLRTTCLAPGALRGRDAFLVTVAGLPGALPAAEALRARHGLTRREAEVARLVAHGLSNADVARRLSISPHTVRHHLETAMAALGVSGRGREALVACLTGLGDA